MSENDEFVQTKRHQYSVFTRIIFWVALGTLLTLMALAGIIF